MKRRNSDPLIGLGLGLLIAVGVALLIVIGAIAFFFGGTQELSPGVEHCVRELDMERWWCEGRG